MLDGLSSLGSIAVVALGIVFAMWTFFICKLIFLGKPRNVAFKAFGIEVNVSPVTCSVCASASKGE